MPKHSLACGVEHAYTPENRDDMGSRDEPFMGGSKDLHEARTYGPKRAARVITPMRDSTRLRFSTTRSM